MSGTFTWPPDIVRCFAAWFTSCSIEIVRKSSYMISTIGRMPWIAAPIPLPTIAISEIGVLRTRAGAELVEQALGDRHRAAHLGDVLAHDEDAVVVLAERLAERVADRLAVGQLRHRRT